MHHLERGRRLGREGALAHLACVNFYTGGRRTDMPKIKTAGLIGPALDWAVATLEGRDIYPDEHGEGFWFRDAATHPDADKTDYGGWELCGPIIEREGISLRREPTGGWYAFRNFSLCTELPFTHCAAFDAGGDTALEAAMRCYVASKLGDEVDVPDELLPKGEQ